MNTYRRLCGLAGAVVLTLCLGLAVTPAFAHNDRVLVFAAASLKNAMDGVVDAYTGEHDTDIRVSYAGSSTLARQIEQGAPADIYVSANRRWMDRLEANHAIRADSRFDLLRNRLVLIAPRVSDITLELEPGVDIRAALGGNGYLAMANTDAVPAGIYGRQALQSLGAWSALQGHIAQADDVRAALALVARGETPLGVVYASDAVAEDRVRVVAHFAEDSHDPIVYPAALLADVDNPSAERLLRFMRGDRARAIFERWGFVVVPAD
ncbi:molybdenum ABC transporter periplasmic molybdate-binding protein [Salinisphaera sp. T5B8]|uniref:molybdate ABC transporter substrate-binding protein n=1 Tax=Salinisphaera sp. T5B8 TaxID=1304154 RepID=UPI003340EF43